MQARGGSGQRSSGLIVRYTKRNKSYCPSTWALFQWPIGKAALHS
jgi:hypothetical protein